MQILDKYSHTTAENRFYKFWRVTVKFSTGHFLRNKMVLKFCFCHFTWHFIFVWLWP